MLKSIEILDEVTYSGSQSANYVLTGNINGRIVKIEIKIDSVGSQSYARSEVWDGNKWNFLTFIPIPLMVTSVYPYATNLNPIQFGHDAQTLINKSKSIL